MTDLFLDPRDEFLAQSDFTPAEQDQVRQVDQPSHTELKAAAALGGLYLLYRTYLRRKLRESMAKDLTTLVEVATSSWQAFVPWWVGIAATQLMTGYLNGVAEAEAGAIDQELLYTVAQNYAGQLGEYINDVSRESLTSGFQAQVNRKVPPLVAARRVSDAYGVPPRTMNSLVSVWTRDEGKQLHDRPVASIKDRQAAEIIESANQQRATQIGSTEIFTAHHQAKHLVWMYGVQQGIIPTSATRKWVTAKDERVCPSCGPLDQSDTAIGEQFETSVGKVWAPPLHPRCRCDVILDYNVMESLQGKIDELSSEPVTKASGTDPYDRDEHGHFAAQESRQPKVKPKVELKTSDPFIADLERQLAEYLATKDTPETKPAQITSAAIGEPARISSPGSMTRSVPQIGGTASVTTAAITTARIADSKIDAASISPARIGSNATISARTMSWMTGTIPTSLPLPRTSAMIINTTKMPTAGDPPKDPEVQEWMPLDVEMYLFKEDNYSNVGVLQVGADELMYLDDASGNKALNTQIGDYWDVWISDKMQKRRGMDKVWMGSDGAHYTLNAEDVEQVYKDTINQEFTDDEGHEVHVDLIREDLRGPASVTMPIHQLALSSGIASDVTEAIPTVYVFKHGLAGSTEINYGRQSYARNPGTWRIMGDDILSQPGKGLYQRHYVEPDDYQ